MASAESPGEASKKPKLDRIRDNQRRSRARKREYLEDLEKRLSYCRMVCREAELQKTAFADLQHENQRLRELLRSSGIEDDAIKAHLSQPQTSSQAHQLRQLKPKPLDDNDQTTIPVYLAPSISTQPLLYPALSNEGIPGLVAGAPIIRRPCNHSFCSDKQERQGFNSGGAVALTDEDLLDFSLDGLDFDTDHGLEEALSSHGWTRGEAESSMYQQILPEPYFEDVRLRNSTTRS